MTADHDGPFDAAARHPHGYSSSTELKRLGHLAVDWLAEWYDQLPDQPVLPTIDPGWVRSQLPTRAPEVSEPIEDVLADLDSVIVPALTNWQSPNWFAYFPGNSSPISALGELLAAGFGQQGMMWSTSPAATELENHVADWLVELLGLPSQFLTTSTGGGVIQDSASSSTLVALLAAREVARQQAPLADQVVYTSAQAHSSVEKGALVAGFEQVRLIGTDEHFAMRAEELLTQVHTDKEQGLAPAFVCSTLGTTGSTAVDPIAAIGEIARSQSMWHHVDAAFAGSAMICPELRSHQHGVDGVDSYTFNPHKWLLTNVDCSLLYVRDREPLIEALSITPEYLRNQHTEAGGVIDYRDWQVPLGRRFRSLKLWMVLRHYGAEGLREMIRTHIRLAHEFRSHLDDDDRFIVLAPTPFSLICFAHRGGDDITQRMHQALNDRGPGYLTHTKLGDRYAIRFVVGSGLTEQRHVDTVWATLDEVAP